MISISTLEEQKEVIKKLKNLGEKCQPEGLEKSEEDFLTNLDISGQITDWKKIAELAFKIGLIFSRRDDQYDEK